MLVDNMKLNYTLINKLILLNSNPRQTILTSLIGPDAVQPLKECTWTCWCKHTCCRAASIDKDNITKLTKHKWWRHFSDLCPVLGLQSLKLNETGQESNLGPPECTRQTAIEELKVDTLLIHSEMQFTVYDPYWVFIYLFLPIVHLYKGGLLFSWTHHARWLQHLHLGQTRDPRELGWWEEPTPNLSLTVPALAQYSATGTYRVQRKRSAFSSWPRTGSSLRHTSRQHGILWEDLPDCHTKPKFQQKMSRVQSVAKMWLSSISYTEVRGWTEPAWSESRALTNRQNLQTWEEDQVSQRPILTPGRTGGLHGKRFKVVVPCYFK